MRKNIYQQMFFSGIAVINANTKRNITGTLNNIRRFIIQQMPYSGISKIICLQMVFSGIAVINANLKRNGRTP
jgi:hypothetical protein